MKPYTLERVSNIDLKFNGEVLADASSYEEGDEVWQEIRIYKTDTDKFVVENVRRSNRAATPEVHNAVACPTPSDVRSALQRQDPVRKHFYFTNLAFDALSEAVENEPALAEAMEERI